MLERLIKASSVYLDAPLYMGNIEDFRPRRLYVWSYSKEKCPVEKILRRMIKEVVNRCNRH